MTPTTATATIFSSIRTFIVTTIPTSVNISSTNIAIAIAINTTYAITTISISATTIIIPTNEGCEVYSFCSERSLKVHIFSISIKF